MRACGFLFFKVQKRNHLHTKIHFNEQERKTISFNQLPVVNGELYSNSLNSRDVLYSFSDDFDKEVEEEYKSIYSFYLLYNQLP